MDDRKEILRKQIFEQFGDQLNELDANIEIIEAESLPSEKELSKKKQYLSYLGKIKDLTVWAVKKGGVIIAFLVFLAQIPDAIDVYKNIYIPKTKQVGQMIVQALDIGKFFDIDDEKMIDDCPNDGVVIVGRKLITSLEVSEEETKKQKGSQTFYMEAGADILPVSSSGMTYNVNPDEFTKINNEIV